MLSTGSESNCFSLNHCAPRADGCIKLHRVEDAAAQFHRTGLTALELLVTLAVVTVVASTGIPALQDVSLTARRAAAVNEFTGLVQFARSSAQTRAESIVLCKADAALRCGDAANEQRWIVGSLTNANPMRVFAPDFPGRIVSNRTQFEFRPFPNSSTNGTVSFCDPRGGAHERAVVISRAGRPRIERPNSASGLQACSAP